MRFFVLIGLLFFMVSCGDGSDYSRGYVITQSSPMQEDVSTDQGADQ